MLILMWVVVYVLSTDPITSLRTKVSLITGHVGSIPSHRVTYTLRMKEGLGEGLIHKSRTGAVVSIAS